VLWFLCGLAAGGLFGAAVGFGILPPWAAVTGAALEGVLVGRKAFAGRRLSR
jgi:hypothetical protein